MEPILLYLLIINLLTLFFWGYDKQMAKKIVNEFRKFAYCY
jgi:uncharacterized membrane protein YsdA (DUF1294 family)